MSETIKGKLILIGLNKDDKELLEILRERIGQSIYRISISESLESLKEELIEELDYEDR